MLYTEYKIKVCHYDVTGLFLWALIFVWMNRKTKVVLT